MITPYDIGTVYTLCGVPICVEIDGHCSTTIPDTLDLDELTIKRKKQIRDERINGNSLISNDT